MIAQNFRGAVGDDADGRANGGRGKLALVPQPFTSPPHLRRWQRGADQPLNEHRLLEQIVATVQAAQPALPRTLIADYYVSLKANPFVVLMGSRGQGKTELVQLFAEAIVGTGSAQYALIPGVSTWHNGTGEDRHYQAVHERFASWRFLELLQEASAPESAGKAYFVCFDAMHPQELEYYLCSLLHVAPNGDKWLSQPGGQPTPVPNNVFITATVDADNWRGNISENVLRHAALIPMRGPVMVATGRVAPVLPPVGFQRVWLRASLHHIAEARQRLVQLLGAKETNRMHCSPALMRLLWRSGIALSSQALQEITSSIANSFAADGRGLFDPSDPHRNAQIAYDAQVLHRVVWRLHSSEDAELWQDVATFLSESQPEPQQAVA